MEEISQDEREKIRESVQKTLETKHGGKISPRKASQLRSQRYIFNVPISISPILLCSDFHQVNPNQTNKPVCVCDFRSKGVRVGSNP